jgi:hypothetical protein
MAQVFAAARPKAATLENWVNATPSGFVFACKAHIQLRTPARVI